MHSVHLAIAAAVALLVHTAAYPVYESGAYRGSDWETKQGDKEPGGFTFAGSRRWGRPETRWGYPAYTAKETEPAHEVVEKAKKVVEEVETKDITVEEEPEFSELTEIDDVDEFDLDAVLFIEEMAEEPGMPPGMAPPSEAPGSWTEYEFYLPWYFGYESAEAPMSMEEPYIADVGWAEFYEEPPIPPMPEASYPPIYPARPPPVYPPEYPPTEAPVPAPEPEAVPVVVVAPPVKKPKKYKKAEKCEKKGPCPCECAETGTPCYCYPALPKRHYPSYYTPQYSPYTHYGKEYPSPYYEPEQPKAIKKPKKTEPHKVKLEPEPEAEAVPVKPHKKPKKPVHEKAEVVVEPKRPKHPGKVEEVPEPEVTKVGVYPQYGYPHGKYGSAYTHYYYGPQEDVPLYCKPPQKCEPETYPGHQYTKHTYPEHEKPAEKKKKKCRKCRKCKRCGPCVEDEHGCAKEEDDN